MLININMPKKKTTKAVKKAIKEVKEEVEEGIKEATEQLGREIGKITHYFEKIGVAVVELLDILNVGDVIRIKGTTTDLKQKVKSMQVEHKAVTKAKKGDAIGLKVQDRVREHDKVYVIKD